MADDRFTVIDMSKKQRSRVTNRSTPFVDGDGRSAWARRWKDIVHDLAEDLGGDDAIGEIERSLIRRAASLTVETERLEGLLSQGEAVDIDALGRVVGHLRRVLEQLKGNRPAKRELTLAERLASRGRAS